MGEIKVSIRRHLKSGMFKFGVPKSYPGHKTLGKHANSKMSQKVGEVHNFECFEYNESYKWTHNDTKNSQYQFWNFVNPFFKNG